MLRRKTTLVQTALWLLPLAFLLVFYFYPLGTIIKVSIDRWLQEGLGGWNTEIIQRAIGFTFYQAGLSTLLTLLLGIPAAWLFSHFRFKGKQFLRVAVTLPFILPTVVVAAGFNALVGQSGWLNLILMKLFDLSHPPIAIQNSLLAILLAHVFYNISIVIRVISSAWEQADVRLENAARTLGAKPARVLWEITIPLLLPSILAAFLLVFLFDFTSFGVILMMGGPRFTTLEVEIYIQTMHFLNLPLASLLALIQLGFSMLITSAIIRMGRMVIVPIVPKAREDSFKKPNKFSEKMIIFSISTILCCVLLMPLLALIAQSLLVQEMVPDGSNDFRWQISLSFFRQLFNNPRQSIFYVPPVQALRNSLLYALSASCLSVTLGLMLAGVSRTNHFFRKMLNWLVMLPLGTSAVTFGLGLFLAFGLQAGAPQWYPFLIPLAHALIGLPFVLRLVEPALLAIPRNLHWAAQTLGAAPRKVWRHIDLPIIWRAALTALVYAFAISLGEFGATSFLTRPDIPTLPIAIYRYLNLPGGANYGQAMAMAVILLIVCAAGLMVVDCLQNYQVDHPNTQEMNDNA